jgi:hypothetical protein
LFSVKPRPGTPARDFLFCDSVAAVVSQLEFISSKNPAAANASSLHPELIQPEIMSRLIPAAVEKVGAIGISYSNFTVGKVEADTLHE